MRQHRWINDYITGLIDMYDTRDIYEIYNCLDIQIVKLPKHNILLQGNESFYQRDYLNQEVVYIRNDLDFKYEKFVLAHELGHAILHTKIYSAAFNKKLLNKGKFEKQANYFALKLLNIKFDPVDFNGFTLEQICSYLHINKECLI